MGLCTLSVTLTSGQSKSKQHTFPLKLTKLADICLDINEIYYDTVIVWCTDFDYQLFTSLAGCQLI